MASLGWKGLINVESCYAFLYMLLVCVHSYVKLILRYKYLILDTCHPDTLQLHEQEYEDPWLFFETKKYP
jgi:hypothetical protein